MAALRFLLWWRAAAGIAALGLALFAVFEVPAMAFFPAAIAATEYGHLFAPLGLLPLMGRWRRAPGGSLGAVAGWTAFLLLLSPLAQAYRVASQLPAGLEAAFGKADPPSRLEAPARPSPLVLADLVFGVSGIPVRHRTVAYGKSGGDALQMDLYLPQDEDRRHPVVVFIHGGSWRAGDRTEMPALCRYLAARGYVVASLDYRLAPKHRFPAPVEDVHAATAWLRARAAELRLDPQRIALVGRSAGGQIALAAAYAGDPGIRGVVAMYAPNDLILPWNATDHFLDPRRVLLDYLGGSPDELFDAYRAASPLFHIGPATPPTLLIHGQRDEIVLPPHSDRLEAALRAAGRPVFNLRLPWATHGCDYNFSGPCGQLSTFAVERFLAAALK